MLTISNDEKMLVKMVEAKLKDPKQFSSLRFVYLRVPKTELQERLRRDKRPQGQITYTVDHYDRFHSALYGKLCDETMDCAGKDRQRVASEVQNLLAQLAQLAQHT